MKEIVYSGMPVFVLVPCPACGTMGEYELRIGDVVTMFETTGCFFFVDMQLGAKRIGCHAWLVLDTEKIIVRKLNRKESAEMINDPLWELEKQLQEKQCCEDGMWG